MSAAAFPHAYPFRFVDTVSQGATLGGGRTAPPEPPGSDGEPVVPPGFQGRVRIRASRCGHHRPASDLARSVPAPAEKFAVHDQADADACADH